GILGIGEGQLLHRETRTRERVYFTRIGKSFSGFPYGRAYPAFPTRDNRMSEDTRRGMIFPTENRNRRLRAKLFNEYMKTTFIAKQCIRTFLSQKNLKSPFSRPGNYPMLDDTFITPDSIAD
ncbi:hypothetical protein, partial [Azotobacter salinestris]